MVVLRLVKDINQQHDQLHEPVVVAGELFLFCIMLISVVLCGFRAGRLVFACDVVAVLGVDGPVDDDNDGPLELFLVEDCLVELR